MKNIFNICVLLAFSSVLFYGCGTSKSFSDKHYNNSYYIGMTKKEKVKDNKQDSDKNISTAENEETVSPVVTETETAPITGENNIAVDETEVVEEQTETASIKEKNSNYSKQSVEKKENKFKIKEIPSLMANKIKNAKEKISRLSNDSDDALSLLWIVIIILLILWAIGWSVGGFGLGGFIHILAAIALILLILWLLKII